MHRLFIAYSARYDILSLMISSEYEIPIPPKFLNADQFCLWIIKEGLKSRRCPSFKAIREMGTHKWWIIRDYSHGANTPECYMMFINISTDRPQLSQYNTAVVAWTPKPFGWGFWERIWRTLKRTNYPKPGDTIQIIPSVDPVFIGGKSNITLKHLKPNAHIAQNSRMLWHELEAKGWTLVAQGETRYVG